MNINLFNDSLNYDYFSQLFISFKTHCLKDKKQT